MATYPAPSSTCSAGTGCLGEIERFPQEGEVRSAGLGQDREIPSRIRWWTTLSWPLVGWLTLPDLRHPVADASEDEGDPVSPCRNPGRGVGDAVLWIEVCHGGVVVGGV